MNPDPIADLVDTSATSGTRPEDGPQPETGDDIAVTAEQAAELEERS